MLLLDGKVIDIQSFGTGEAKISKKQIDELLNFNTSDMHKIVITYWHEDNNDEKDLYLLYLLKSYIDFKLSVYNYIIQLNFTILPYARMDRENDYYLFTLKYISNYINQMNFNKVVILEPHSDVSLGAINNSESLFIADKLFQQCKVVNNLTDDEILVIFPDSGAQARYAHLIKPKYFAVGFKSRVFKTREISNLHLKTQENIPLNLKNIFIIDDIIATGGTIQKLLDEFDCKSKNIYVIAAHCENTVFKGTLLKNDRIKQIYTTNSTNLEHHNKIEIYDVKQYF